MMHSWQRSSVDLVAGALTVGVGAFVVQQAFGYDLGTARDMGPGYFPMIAGIALIVFGIGIALVEVAPEQGDDDEPIRARPLLLVTASIIAFALLVERAGLAPATFLLVFLCSIADRESSLLFAAILATCVTVFAVGIFVYALGLQISAFGA